jgi:hypothetical protein
MIQSRVRRILPVMAMALSLAATDGAGAAQDSLRQAGPGVVLTPEDGAPIAGKAPVTFGMVFRPGDIPRGRTLAGRAGGNDVPLQADIKRRHPDGSVRFAVLSSALPAVPAAGIRLDLVATPEDAKAPPPPDPAASARKMLESGFDAVVEFRFPDGKATSASARKMLEAALKEKPRLWLSGPLVTEFLLDGPPVDAQGEQDPDLNVLFQMRFYEGCDGVWVSVVVENCWDTWGGNVGYDVEVRVGKEPAYAKKNVDHPPLSRWRKSFWWGRPRPAVHTAHDIAYLSATGALPNYDPARKVPEKDLAAAAEAWAKAKTDILENGTVTLYMPTTGMREDIGPYPRWAVRHILSMDPRAERTCLGNGDLAASWPIHVRNRATRGLFTIDERPKFWLNGRGEDKPGWRPNRKEPAAKSAYSPDNAHMPSLAYLPYLLTGDFFFLEEMYFWAGYSLVSQWPHPRQDGKGLVVGDQVRGQAWSLRNIADAAFIGPDDDPLVRYFDEKVRHNLAWYVRTFYGPPEYNALGFYSPRDVQDARLQNPANPRWLITAPWEHDFLIWSWQHLVELGYDEAARPRDFELRWRVGALTHAPDYDPGLAMPYRMVVGEKGADGKEVFYDDWKKLGEENARLSKPDAGYGYSTWIALVAALDARFPGAEEALRVFESRVPPARRAGYDWFFAIQPRREPLRRP